MVVPGAVKVNGKSKVLPFVVIFWVPDVAVKLTAPVPAETVMPVEIVRFPFNATAALENVPAKPVKSTLLAILAALNVTISVPADTLKLGRIVPETMVLVPVAPE